LLKNYLQLFAIEVEKGLENSSRLLLSNVIAQRLFVNRQHIFFSHETESIKVGINFISTRSTGTISLRTSSWRGFNRNIANFLVKVLCVIFSIQKRLVRSHDFLSNNFVPINISKEWMSFDFLSSTFGPNSLVWILFKQLADKVNSQGRVKAKEVRVLVLDLIIDLLPFL
jgi:hypothetical protein